MDIKKLSTDPIKIKLSRDRIQFMDGKVLIKNLFGENLVYYVIESKSDYENHKPLDFNITLNLNRFTILDTSPLLEIIENKIKPSLNKNDSRISESPASVELSLNPLDKFDKIFRNWDLIDFENRWVYINFKNKNWRLPCDIAKVEFNHMKSIFKELGLVYTVRIQFDQPRVVKLPDNLPDLNIFRRVPDMISIRQSKQFLGQIDNLLNNFHGATGSLSVAIHGVTRAFNYSKSSYFNKLAKWQNDATLVSSVLEPQSNNIDSFSWVLSFLFTHKSRTGYHIIWESTEREKATYVFTLRTESAYRIASNKLQSWLSDPSNYPVRSTLRRNPPSEYGVVSVITHNNQETYDPSWDIHLKSLIL